MSEVGVLNLTIKDNSGTAAEGLKELTGALIKVQEAVGTGLKLSGISRSIKSLSTTVGSSTKVLTSLGSFMNAITAYSKAFKDTESLKFNRKPIDDLKQALGEGIKIGQAGTQINKLREALEGEWNVSNAKVAGEALKAIADGARSVAGVSLASVATNITKVATALDKYASAAEKVKDVLGKSKSSAADSPGMAAAKEAGVMFAEKEGGGLRLNLQAFARKRSDMTGQAQQMSMELDGLLKEVQSKTSSIASAYGNMADSISRFSYEFAHPMQFLPNITEGLPEQFQHSAETARMYGSAVGATLPKLQEMSSEEMVVAGNARAATEAVGRLIDRLNETQKDKGFADRFNWSLGIGKQIPSAEDAAAVFNSEPIERFNIALMETGDTITSVVVPAFQDMYQIWSQMAYEFGAFAHEASRLMSGDSPLMLGAGQSPLLLGAGGVAPENALSKWVDYGQQFMTNWVYFASDAADQWRAMWSPDFILGGWNAPASMASFALGSGQTPLLLGSGGVAPGNELSTAVDTSEQWKQDWIVVDGTVSDVAEEIGEITGATAAAASATRDMSEAEQEYARQFAEILRSKEQEAAIAAQIRAAQEEAFYAEPATLTMDQTNAMADNLSQLDLLKAQLREAEQEYNKFVNELGAGDAKTIKAGLAVQGLRDKIWDYTEALREANAAQEESIASSGGLGAAFGDLKTGVANLISPVTSLAKRFLGMAKMRAMRYIIRQLAAGFSEGVQNVYQYSNAVGTSLAPAMDAAATSIQQMKNSIGAMAAPLIQAIVPALQTVISWVITAINYLNQFFALLNGQTTWTRALPESAKAFEKTKKAAGGAGKAMKDLLADWDELNIIQSNSGGGGGGGGGSNMEEIKNMFEEVNKFDDAVKDTVGFINEYLGGIPGLLAKAGLALLGWKFSKAFTGILGKLGKIVGGAALGTIGIELAYGSGFEAGKKGYFDTADILGAIGGTIASGIGGYMIGSAIGGPFGGKVGLIIGLGVGIATTIYGWVKGKQDALDAAKWGDLHKTAEEIESYVRSLFDFDVVSEIEVMDAHIQNFENAKQLANTEIEKFSNSLDNAIVTVRADVPDEQKVQSVLTAARDAYSAVQAVNAFIEEHKENMTYTLSNLQFKDSEGNLINEELLKDTIEIDQAVQDYLTGIGKELTKYIKKGELEGLTGGEQEAALALMERERKILALKDQYSEEFNRRIQLDVGKQSLVDRDTALAELAREKELMTQWEEEAKQLVQQDVDGLKEVAAIAEAAAQDALEQGDEKAYNDLHDKAEKALADAVILASPEGVAAAVEEKLKPTKDRLREIWTEYLLSAYGGDIDQSVMESTFPNREGFWQELFGWITGPTESAYKQGLKSSGDRGKFIRDWFEKEFRGFDVSGILKDAMDMTGVNLWDLMSEGARKNLFMNTADSLGNMSQARQAIMSAFGLTYDDIAPYVENYEAYLKQEAKETAKDIDNIVNEVANGGTSGTIDNQENPFAAFNFGLGYKAPESVGSDIMAHIDEVTVDNAEDVREQIVEQIDDGKLHITPDIELSTDAANYLQMVENAVNSGKGMEEIKAASAQAQEMYGIGAFLEAQPYINQLMEMYRKIHEMTPTGESGALGTPWRTTAMGGASSVNYANNTQQPQQATLVRTEQDNVQDANNVASGVQRGSSELLGALNTLISVAQAINRKEFTVNISPSASWGQFSTVSGRQLSKMTGNQA